MYCCWSTICTVVVDESGLIKFRPPSVQLITVPFTASLTWSILTAATSGNAPRAESLVKLIVEELTISGVATGVSELRLMKRDSVNILGIVTYHLRAPSVVLQVTSTESDAPTSHITDCSSEGDSVNLPV